MEEFKCFFIPELQMQLYMDISTFIFSLLSQFSWEFISVCMITVQPLLKESVENINMWCPCYRNWSNKNDNIFYVTNLQIIMGIWLLFELWLLCRTAQFNTNLFHLYIYVMTFLFSLVAYNSFCKTLLRMLASTKILCILSNSNGTLKALLRICSHLPFLVNSLEYSHSLWVWLK